MDIDIDLKSRTELLEKINYIVASRNGKQGLEPHNVGVYLQPIPKLPSGLSSIEYKEAEQRGYFKLDFLNLTVYENVRSNKHLDELLHQPVDWSLLKHEDIARSLFHLDSDLAMDAIKKVSPTCIEELAIVLALIRPGKIHLLDESMSTIEKEIWKPSEKYYFKNAHALSYAAVVVVQLNLLVEQANTTTT